MLRFACMLSAGIVLGLATLASAEDKKETKEVTLKGTITCPKCDLGTADKCATVIVVKEKGKDVIYWFDAAGDKKHHGKICKTPTEGTVVGAVSKDGDKMIVTVSKVEFKK